MEMVIWDSNVSGLANWFVARIAVCSTISRHDTVDLLHNVKLTTGRPSSAMTHRIAQHPEGGPDTLLGRVGPQRKAALEGGDLASLRGPRLLSLYTTGGPSPIRVAHGDDLDSLATGMLDVLS